MMSDENQQERRHWIDPRVDQLVVDVKNIRTELSLNTEVTTQVRDAINSFKIIAKIAKWVTAIAACGASLLALWHGLYGSNDITPR